MRRSTIWANKPFRAVAALLFWLIVWQLAAMAVGIELLLPRPITVARALLSMLPTAAFWESVLSSLLRVFGGFAVGTVLGVLLAALTAYSAPFDALLAPAIRLMRTVPVASFIVLALLWLKSWLLPGVIAAIVVLPVVWGNVRAGIASVDVQYLEVARSYRFGRFQTLRLVMLPSVLPYFRAAVLSAVGMGWKAGVAAEVLCQPKLSIGAHLYNAKIYLETDQLFAWTVVVIVLSLLFEKALQALVREGERHD
jgi:NitT/TauT family transport system permease protein